jgi:hypothetical protein
LINREKLESVPACEYTGLAVNKPVAKKRTNKKDPGTFIL